MPQVSTRELIQQLIPFTQENLVKIPLWEEGIYLPQVNIWLPTENRELLDVVMEASMAVSLEQYEIDYEVYRDNIAEISIMPKWERADEYGFKLITEDWELDKMLLVATTVVYEYERRKDKYEGKTFEVEVFGVNHKFIVVDGVLVNVTNDESEGLWQENQETIVKYYKEIITKFNEITGKQ
jgi:hypothetical protein